MKNSFEKTLKSILYIGVGCAVAGTFLDTVSNSLSLINFQITLWGSIAIGISWLALYLWIRANKPYWGNGKYRISKPNLQINLFVLGIIVVFWIPVAFNELGIKQSSNDDINRELLEQNSKLLQLAFQLKIECENLMTSNCEKEIEKETGRSISNIKEISKEVESTSTDYLDRGNAAAF